MPRHDANECKDATGRRPAAVRVTDAALLPRAMSAATFAAVVWTFHVVAIPARAQPPQVPQMSAPSPFSAYNLYLRAGRAIVRADEIGMAIARRQPASATGGAKTGSRVEHHFSRADKESLLKRNAPALRLLRQGFIHRYRRPLARSSPDMIGFDIFRSARNLSRLLVLEAQVKAAHGQRGAAADSLLDGLRLGGDIPRGSPFIGMLVGYACQAIARREMRQLYEQLDAPSARRAARRMEVLITRSVSYADTLRVEKQFGQMAHRETMSRPNWRAAWLEEHHWDDLRQETAARLRLPLFSDRAIADNYTRYMDALITEAQQPYARRAPVPSPADPVNAGLADVFGHTAGLFEARNRTLNALLLASLALRAYKLEHGSYPPTLKALVPIYIRHVPADSFAAAGPLRFKRVGSSYVLYSVGPDGRDDKGRPITAPLFVGQRPNGENNIGVESKGDIVMQPRLPAKTGG